VTNAVDRLEADGLVSRRANPDDGRGTLATITDAGRQLATEATGLMNEQLFSSLHVDESLLGDLFGSLSQLRQAAGDFA
jgi:DNA-binding MarR family transcriptional regulator